MRKIVLEGKYLIDRESAHEYLQEKLALPKYYGKNLDALYDCLTELDEMEIEIDTSDIDLLENDKNMFLFKMKRVFYAASSVNENLKVTFTK